MFRSCCLLIRKDGNGGEGRRISSESLNGLTKENMLFSISVYDNKFTSTSRVLLFSFIHMSLLEIALLYESSGRPP